jgi:carbon-monoxide dehydrogenase medium subunit
MMTIAENADGFLIGAAVPSAELNEHAALKAAWPGVVEAMDLVGSTQIQGRASLGGNICNGSPAADSVPAMIAAGAICTIAGPNGLRDIAVDDIVTGPGKTSLAADEILVNIRLAPKQAGRGDAYLRMIPRTEMDIAVVGVGICLSIDEAGICTDAKVALGAVGPTQIVLAEAEGILVGTNVGDDALASLAAAASAAATPIDDKRGTVSYRKKVTGVLAKRAAVIALERAGKSRS